MPLVVVSTGSAGGQWVNPDDLAACAPEGVDVDLAAEATADLMFALSGHQYGTVTETVRPFRLADVCGCAGALPSDAYSFSWTSHSAWARAASCACSGSSYVRLLAPVIAIGEVLVDGVALVAEDDYRLYDGLWLVRADGARWPCCQDLTVPSSELGTWAITYTHGIEVPAAGQVAAIALGCEIAKAMGGASDCALTGRIQSVTRDGVSAVIVDSQDFLREGRTGIGTVDLWLATLGNLRAETATIARPGRISGLLRPVDL